jgi:adenylate kinase family enzyme
VVKQRLSEHDWNYGYIIDGFPRNQRQAEFFLESYDLDGVIHLDLPDSEVARRVLARRLCAGCGMDYSLIDNSPSKDGMCDACGGELIRREDDTQGGARRPAPRVPREDQSRAGHLPPQGVRHHGGHPARQAAGPAGHQGPDRAAALSPDGGEQPG